jgi:hypothetical protein
MKFYVFGPFEIIRDPETGLVAHDNTSKKSFWEIVDKSEDGLADACGCYVFALSAGGSKRPWYVGKAEKQTFRAECFQPHKINVYNSIVGKLTGRPLLYLIAKVTPKDRFSKPSSNGSAGISTLENMIIGISLARNIDLLNLKGTKCMRELVVHGVINAMQGNPGSASSDLRKTLGL